MMLIVRRPSSISSSPANWRASCGGHISPHRTASSSLICSVMAAIPPANGTPSIPSAYPDGNSTLSNPLASAVVTMSQQCAQDDRNAGSGTPRYS
jgi:hypothetical protein